MCGGFSYTIGQRQWRRGFNTMKALTLLTFGVVAGLTSVAHADFFEDFDTDTSANWIKLTSNDPANHEASFSFEYFADRGATPGFRIPSAPGSTGGTTKGLRLRTNTFLGAISGISASPVGQAFTGNFDLTADIWLNYFGPGPLGASGTTQLANMGWGTAGTTAQTNQNNAFNRDSVFFSTTLDGGSNFDYRAHALDSRFTLANGYYYAAGTAAGGAANEIPGIYAAGDAVGNLNASNVYYSTAFPAEPLLAAQAATYPSQTGTTGPGSTGFKWRAWKLEKRGNIMKWYIDGVLLATVDLSFCTVASEPNLLIGMMDSNNGSAVDPDGLNSMIVDNIRVVSITANQQVSGTLSLSDTSATFAFPRNISYEVVQGTLTVASGAVVANSPSSPFNISLPSAVTGAVTIKWDGSSFLKRNTLASLTGSNQAIGNVVMQNGDVDASGEVDAADIDAVIADFGGTADSSNDVDVSGEVDAADIDIVIANFGGTDD